MGEKAGGCKRVLMCSLSCERSLFPIRSERICPLLEENSMFCCLHAYSRRASGFAGLLLCGVIAGCTTVQVESYQQVTGGLADVAYVKQGTDFSVYRTLLPAPLEIYYSEEGGGVNEEDLERIRTIFREAFIDQVVGDYEIVQEPAADALRVRASLVDLKINPSGGTAPAHGKLSSLVASGKLTFFMEVRDSLSDEVLGRAGDAEKLSRDRAVARDEWAQVEDSARRWARLFRKFLDDNLGR